MALRKCSHLLDTQVMVTCAIGNTWFHSYFSYFCCVHSAFSAPGQSPSPGVFHFRGSHSQRWTPLHHPATEAQVPTCHNEREFCLPELLRKTSAKYTPYKSLWVHFLSLFHGFPGTYGIKMWGNRILGLESRFFNCWNQRMNPDRK